jgi:hypothetical protein
MARRSESFMESAVPFLEPKSWQSTYARRERVHPLNWRDIPAISGLDLAGSQGSYVLKVDARCPVILIRLTDQDSFNYLAIIVH